MTVAWMQAVRALWTGDTPLPVAYWRWAVLGGVAVNATSTAACLALVVHDRPLLAVLAGYAPSLPYNVIVTVGVWRAADRYTGEPVWATLARVTSALGMVVLSLT